MLNSFGWLVSHVPTLVRLRREAQALVGSEQLHLLHGQAGRFTSEHEYIPRLETHAADQARAFGRHGELPPGIAARAGQRLDQAVVHLQVCPLVVIQSGPLQPFVVQLEAQRPHQMQHGAGIGRKADDIAGVRRNLG